jgi:hypothetical protein
MAKQPSLGSGTRFKNLKNKLVKQKGIKDPAAVAAVAGVKAYGQKKMTQMAQKGKKK